MNDMNAAAIVAPTVRKGSAPRVAVGLTMALVLAAVVAALFLVGTVDRQLGDVVDTFTLRGQARELLLSSFEAETAQRGFLATQDEKYLDGYDRAITAIEKQFTALKEQVPKDSAQGQRIAELEPLLAEKHDEMATTIRLVNEGRLGESLALMRSGVGEALMERTRVTVRAFIDAQSTRLATTIDELRNYRQMLVAAIIAALLAAAALAYFLFSRAMRKVSELAQRENLLLVQNEELEAHVKARTVEVEEARGRAERERERLETLLQDTNHRIGNSLATVSSLLGLQLARTGSDEVRRALEAAQGRVHAIASGHRRLRLGADLETTEAAEFLSAVVDDLKAAVPPEQMITFHEAFVPMVIPARDATTLGIVVSELVTNAVKHAFEGRPGGNIWIRLVREGEAGTPCLIIEDDGTGLGEEAHHSTGLGALIIKQLARQFGGEPAYGVREGGGTIVTVPLPGLVKAND